MTKIAVLVLTNQGITLARTISQRWSAAGLPIYVPQQKVAGELRPYPLGSLKLGFQQLFKEYDALICIMATGIVVRHLAPILVDKREDPAVLVLDEGGQNVISLLSGHLGGANQLTRELAALLGSNPVITTATDVQGVAAIDTLAQEVSGWYQDFKTTTKWINGLLADHQPVALLQDQSLVQDKRGFTEVTTADDLADFAALVLVSEKPAPVIHEKVVQVVPRRYVLGIGAKKDTPFTTIKEEYLHFCQSQELHPYSIKSLASIDLKQNEAGIQALAEWLEVPFITYSAAELAPAAEKYPQSEFVKKTTGVGAVSQAAADLASGGKVVSDRYAHRGVTFALGRPEKESIQTGKELK